jgi:ribosomal protein S18 acetylase RimI-like enzyme
MEDVEIRKVGLSDLFVIEELAKIIWREHYTPIIGSNQVAYMLANFQSVAVMQEQISSGYSYHLMIYQEEPVGYLSIRKDADAVFLSKIYVLKDFRGKGIARAAMNFVISETLRAGLGLIRLTVNKKNTGSIHAYEKMGFQNMDSVVTEIGEGYVMDDFVMEMEIPKTN